MSGSNAPRAVAIVRRVLGADKGRDAPSRAVDVAACAIVEIEGDEVART